MKLVTLALGLLASTAAWATDAPEVTNNPIGAQYLAEFPATGDQGVIASFAVASLADGSAVSFTININGAPFNGGPFLYHIHDVPVPAGGNCTGTKAHLDPYSRGEDPPCNADNPRSCQVGDLSGKYGKIPELPGFSANYTDKFVSLTPGTPAFFGDRSIVLHYANKTRIACANFHKVEHNSTTSGNGTYILPGSPTSTAGGSDSTGTGTGIGGATTSGSRPPPGAQSSRPASGGLRTMVSYESIVGPALCVLALMVLS